MRQSGEAMMLPGGKAGVAERVQQVQEAPLRQVVAGELPANGALQQAEVRSGPEQRRRGMLDRGCRTTRVP